MPTMLGIGAVASDDAVEYDPESYMLSMLCIGVIAPGSWLSGSGEDIIRVDQETR